MTFSDDPRDRLTNFPRLLKGAIVALNSSGTVIEKAIYFQYNPETLSRSLQVKAGGQEGSDRTESLRLKGPPTETIQLEAEFETTGPLSDSEFAAAGDVGIYPQLSALETLIYPASQQVRTNLEQARQGTIEVAPFEAPLTLLIWGKKRILPVRLTDFSITEEAYDVNLNPIRAKVSLSLRVLTYDDLPREHRGSRIFLAHHEEKERLSRRGSINYDPKITGVQAGEIFR